jgi:hypothetical protein
MATDHKNANRTADPKERSERVAPVGRAWSESGSLTATSSRIARKWAKPHLS